MTDDKICQNIDKIGHSYNKVLVYSAQRFISKGTP